MVSQLLIPSFGTFFIRNDIISEIMIIDETTIYNIDVVVSTTDMMLQTVSINSQRGQKWVLVEKRKPGN